MYDHGFKGAIRNIVPSRSIPDGTLADCINLDIDDAGALVLMRGSRVALNVPNSSAYSTQSQQGYVVSNGILNEVLPDMTLILLTNSTADEFTDHGGILFCNDGVSVDSGKATNLKIPTPTIPLNLVPSGGSELQPGTYQATYTYRIPNGLEGGTAPIAAIELTDVGNVYIEPPPAIAGFVVTVYFTDCNGTVFYGNDGIKLEQSNLLADPFPDDVQKIAYHESKLFCSVALPDGQTAIIHSKPFYYHLFNYAKNYFIVPGEVRGMMSAGSALIIATDKQLLAYNDGLTVLADYGCPQGRPLALSPNGQVMIHSDRGECVALPFQNLTEGKCSLSPGTVCSTKVIHQRGMQQFIVLTDGMGDAFNAYKDQRVLLPPTEVSG